MSDAEVKTLEEILKRVESRLDKMSEDIDSLKAFQNRVLGIGAFLILLNAYLVVLFGRMI